MPRTSAYRIPSETVDQLEALVDRIEAHPGRLLDPARTAEAFQRLDTKAVLGTLPEGFSEEDFAGVLKLSLFTECATQAYSDLFQGGAEEFSAPWLGRFNANVWTPDERDHHAPFKYLLLSLGYSEEELDRKVREVQELTYTHSSGKSPVELTTFGLVQEYLTDHWYGLIAGLMRPAAPEATQMVVAVKMRETLHTVWYRDMTAMQVEGNPELLPLVADTMASFQMPSNALIPELQGQVQKWMPHMNADFPRMVKEMARLVYEIMGNTKRSAQLLLEIATRLEYRSGPIPLNVVKNVLNRLGGPGYSLAGEAVLESVGLDHLYRGSSKDQDRMPLMNRASERLRAPVRSWIARKITVRFDPEPA